MSKGMIEGKISDNGSPIIVLTKSADTLLGTALLRGMEVRLNYSTKEVVVEKKVKLGVKEGRG